MSLESPNKENYTGTPSLAALGSPKLDDYSPSTKRVLKPISPNKTSNSHVGRLSFLQNDNIDDHFDQLHSSQHDMQQLLLILEAQTKQTGLDLGQLVDRLKNNNANLNKLLQSIAAYSEEVVTEGNATKNDITSIVARLDAFNHHLETISSRDTASDTRAIQGILEKRLLDITKQLDDSLKSSRQYNEMVREQIQHSLRSDNLKTILSSELNTAQAEQKERHGELLSQFESIGIHVGEVSAVKEDLLAEFERTRAAATQQSNKLFEILQPVHESRDLKNFAEIIAKNHSLVLEQHNYAIKEFNEIKERLPSDSVRQIVDPIIAELKAVSLDQKSLKLLEDILSILGNERRSHELDQRFQETSISRLRAIDEKVALGHLEVLQKLDSHFQAKPSNSSDEIGLLKVQIENQLIIIRDLKLHLQRQEESQDIESKVTNLEKKYENLCSAYQRKFDEFQDLEKKFAQLNSKLGSEDTTIISSEMNPALKMKKIRKLHSYKMGELEERGRAETQKKRILSTPVQYGVQSASGNSSEDVMDV